MFIFNLKTKPTIFQQKPIPRNSVSLAGGLPLYTGWLESDFHFIFFLLGCSSIICDITAGCLQGFSLELDMKRNHLPSPATIFKHP